MKKRFSIRLEIRKMNVPGFVELKMLGKGTYGSVYKAKRLSDGQSYAVKIVNLGNLNHKEVEDSVNEIRLMASFTSPFIIRFYEAFCDNRRLCIVSEYSRLGDLSQLIERRKKKKRPFKEDAIWRYLLQILEGLKVLHNCGVVHRDLKSANILLSGPDLIKIADLGISTVLHSTQLAKTQIGTPFYLAPEIWKRRPYDSKCDMWSLGILLYEMMTFQYPFLARSTQELAQRVCLGSYSAPRGYSSELTSIVRRLLQINPVLRPSVDELLLTQAVSSRIGMLSAIVNENELIETNDTLLSTIKVPLNVRNMNLPGAAYNKKRSIVKPLEQRLHMKKGVSIKKDVSMVTSPELQLITELDWWSPNKIGQFPLIDENREFVQRPMSQRPVLKPMPPPQPPAAAHRPRPANERQNPRFKRIGIH